MNGFIQFVSRLIYGTGAEAVVSPNHQSWLTANPSPTGSAWLTRYVDGASSLLGLYEDWLRANSLTPIYPWNGTDYALGDTSDTANAGAGVPLPANLDPTSLSFASVDALGAALRSRLSVIQGPAFGFNQAGDLQDPVKAPYSHRFWGYLKWSSLILRRFGGELVDFNPPALYDRDGTLLSAIPFLNIVNQAHWRWHDFDPAFNHHSLSLFSGGPYSPAGSVTPGHRSSVGQNAGAAAQTRPPADRHEALSEEFLYFHREHVQMFNDWLARTGQPAQPAINMLSVMGASSASDRGWPPLGAGGGPPANPSTWVPSLIAPWANSEAQEATDRRLIAFESRGALAGTAMGNYHARGHNANPDIRHPFMNNYVPRFFTWHHFLDEQWFLREPRFARWDAATGLRERVFRPVLPASGAAWPGMNALTIVRDPSAATDAVSPAGAVTGLNLTTGAGTLRVQLVVKDTYDRLIRMRLRAQAFDDAAGTAIETLPDVVQTVGTGGAFAQGAEFTVDFAFATAFRSSDPARAAAGVGFVASRIRVTGTLEAADGSDPGFVHEDVLDIDLVQEGDAPAVDIYLNLSSFGENQVQTQPAEPDGTRRFRSAVIVSVQDRTSRPAPIVWPATMAEGLKNLLSPRVPAAGLFDDTARAPTVVLWRPASDTEFSGVSLVRASGPDKEDPSLPDNIPQRFTYVYDAVFAPGHDAFAGVALGGSQLGRLRVAAADRSGNGTTEQVGIKLFRDANPFMIDGDPAWLSRDTRVLRIFAGEALFGVTMVADQPLDFIRDLLVRLNDPSISAATRDGWFDSLPTFAGQDVLEFSTEIRTPSTGAVRKIYNFALGRARLRGTDGASDVRGFFRLFTYAGTNLFFDESQGYRVHTDGTRVVPLLGFAATGEVTSIPFFATARRGFAEDMRTQPVDTPNVALFPTGISDEQHHFFGAYLDINQDGARLPPGRVADPARVDGPFTSGEVQPIRTLIRDAHQCMVLELRYDGDPTASAETPFTSDNLAQRNLAILWSDNPGAEITRTVEHSFEAETRRAHVHTVELDDHGAPLFKWVPNEADARRLSMVARALTEFPTHGHGDGGGHDTGGHDHETPRKPTQGRVTPIAFDSVTWSSTLGVADELLFVWNGLPAAALVELYLPGVRAEEIINLRHARHAPDDVRIVDEHTVRITPGGVSYVPLPPSEAGRVAGVITIGLPDGVRAGQSWPVDVLQLRGNERRAMGALRIDVRVGKDLAGLAEAERRLLALLFERRSLLARGDRWLPILDRRVKTTRGRARAFAERAGIEWKDPTMWTNPADPARPVELQGPRLRVVLEKIEVRKDFDPWIKGRGELVFVARVATASNGGQLQRTRLPEHGVLKISDRPGHNVVELDAVIFEGHATDDLRIEVVGTEKDLLDPDDWVGKFSRVFGSSAATWFGAYGPDDGPMAPEDVGPWRLYYRIERGAAPSS